MDIISINKCRDTNRGGRKKLCKLEDILVPQLNDEQKERLSKLQDAIFEIEGENATERFVYGYRLGALIMMKVITECDEFIVSGMAE